MGDCSPKVCSIQEQLRMAGHLCDAVLLLQDVQFPVHKVIMCKCSLYFRSLFVRWSRPNQRIYDITGTTPEVMNLIIEFAYTGSVSVTAENVMGLMIKADEFNIKDLIQACSHFMGEHLHPENCIGIWQLTKIYTSPKLHLKAYRYILNHFEEVVSVKEFLQLTVLELADFIGRDDLIVGKESIVYEGMMRWITSALHQRRRHFHFLLSKIRLSLMSLEFIRMSLLSNHLVINDSRCFQLVMNAHKNQHYLIYTYGDIDFCNPSVRPRLSNVIMLATGGWSRGNPTNVIEAYDYRVNKWVSLASSGERPCGYHGTAFLDGFIYFIGGFNRIDYFNTVRRFDPVMHHWQEMAPMHSRRCYVSVTVLNGLIYAMGGHDGHSRLNSVEYYQPQHNQWNLMAPMNEQRSDACCTVLQDKIYICGGFNGSECLQSAECYDPQTNQWTLISSMNTRRSGVGVIAHGGYIYAIGGCDGTSRLDSAEVYNAETNSWAYLSSMATTRSNFGIEVIDDRIYVVGGYNGITVTAAVESYDCTLDRWSGVRSMGISRSALSCCLVYGLPNMAEYSFNRDNLPFLQLDKDEEEEHEEQD